MYYESHPDPTTSSDGPAGKRLFIYCKKNGTILRVPGETSE
ncbi:8162_t:CDS:2 [Acaulospora morrowiae]|uniref:8162_t:CDS:1 n=1 Tax=Acaulospora morrowiae TaxID=94023 RepID=A0A9N8YSV1_9GLOM|nr:8162_t:CDS:2 [Acaulospora morrowiae]